MKSMPPEQIIIAITGASGSIYGIEALRLLRQMGVVTHLVVSRSGALTCQHETGFSRSDLAALADHVHRSEDIGACIASGSARVKGMLIAPCSMRTLAEVATGLTTSLVSRAADVTLKERRPLVLLARETPLNLSHIENMAMVTRMGGIIAPPVPAFYNHPATIDDIVRHTVGRVLDLFHLDVPGMARWQGITADNEHRSNA